MGNTSDGTFTTFEIPDSFGEKWRRMFTSAAEVFDFDLSTLSILYEDRVHILAQGGTVDDLTNRVIDYDFIKCIIERNQPHAIFDLREDSQWQNSPIVQAGFVSAAGFPLRDDDGTPFGTLCVLRTHPAPYPDSHFKLFESFAHSVEVEINAFRDKAKLHEERERRQTAEHLVENAKDLHSMLFDSSLDMMLIHDETGKILDVNARVLERLGYDTSELIGQSPGIIAAPEYAPKAKMRLEQIFTHGEAFFRTQLITKSSEELAVEVTSQLFKWKGKPAIFSVVRELESRRIPEEELEDHKYMIRVSEKVGNMGHWIIDLIDGNLEWSATQYLLHGVEPGSVDATMDFFLSTVHPDDRQWVQNAVEEAIATKTPREAEFRIVLPDGRIRWIRSQNTFLYRGEKAVKFFGIDQDITEEKALIQELEESREHYKSLIENLGDTTAVLRHAIDGTILYLSPSIEPMFGYKPEEGLGKKVQEVCEYSPESLARIETAIGEMVTSGKTITIEVAFKHRDGSWRWNISHAHPVRNSSDQIECIEVVATDITRRKILELELAENEALLKEAQRVGIIGHWSLVPESGHLEWSDETYRIWGIEPGSIDLNLEYALSSVHREDKSRVAKELQRAIESDIPFSVEFRVTRP
ncbi:MAG: hypothetical protein CL946_04505, partial [Ectothiorhodospiraceae bacterium]|nr:hypothetical protein [Ectothiorhodospiraceae bacterium]